MKKFFTNLTVRFSLWLMSRVAKTYVLNIPKNPEKPPDKQPDPNDVPVKIAKQFTHPGYEVIFDDTDKLNGSIILDTPRALWAFDAVQNIKK